MAHSSRRNQSGDSLSLSPERLSDAEKLWVSHEPYLFTRGYQLRPRYRPGWVPSWTRTGQNPYDCEDGFNSMPIRTLDALRLSDNAQVMIKIVVPSQDDREGSEELEILQRLSSEPYRSDPANHSVQCLDSFPMPSVENGMFYVMPLLTAYDNPPFYNLYEINDFLAQIFEGLQFLHENDVAHCDIAASNILMDGRGLYDEPFHPFNQHLTLDGTKLIIPKYTRSQVGPRYYYIDFGYAKWFRDPNEPRVVAGSRARERTPEQLSGEPYDPFKLDVYQLGAIIRRSLIPNYPSTHFLLPLAREMTSQDPNKRPSLDQARRAMEMQFTRCYGWRKRWPIIPPNAPLTRRFAYILAGVTTEIVSLLRNILRAVSFVH